MAAPLRLVDGNGELKPAPTYLELQARCERLDSDARTWHSRYQQAQRELDERRKQDPRAVEIRAVLTYWAERVYLAGHWQRRPRFNPGDMRWRHTSARLKQYTVEDLKKVVDAALDSDFHRQRREFLDAESIFENAKKTGAHLERALETPDVQQVRCDCGHRAWEHMVNPDNTLGACKVGGKLAKGPARCCECVEFGTCQQTVQRWLAEQRSTVSRRET